MKPHKSCVNGDGRPIQPPSEVLCAECFRQLGEQVRGLPDVFDAIEARQRAVRVAALDAYSETEAKP